MNRRFALLVVPALCLAAVPVPAHASYVRTCISGDTWTFDPALGAAPAVGSVTLDYTVTCARVDSSGSISSETYSSSLPGSYVGTCAAVVLLSPYYTGAIVAGTAGVTFLAAGTRMTASARVVDPTGLCGQMSGTGVAVDVGV